VARLNCGARGPTGARTGGSGAVTTCRPHRRGRPAHRVDPGRPQLSRRPPPGSI